MTALPKMAITGVRIVVSALLIWLLLSRIEMHEFLDAVRGVSLVPFLFALTATAVSVLIRSARWWILLHVQGVNLKLRTIHALDYMGLFFNNFFLGSIGGDTFRIYRTMRYTTHKLGAVSSVLVDRFIGLFSMLVVLLIFIISWLSIGSVRANYGIISEDMATLFVGIGLVLCVAGWLTGRLLRSLNVPSLKKQTSRLAKLMGDFTHTLQLYQQHKTVFAAAIALSLAFLLVRAISLKCHGLAAGEDVSFSHMFLLATMAPLILMLPISINGIGLQEGLFAFYLESLGVDSASALLIALLPRGSNLIFSLIGGCLFLFEKRLLKLVH